MMENYITYLKFLEAKLEKFFDKQKPYIFCQKGCGMCCRNAQFPYSKMEMDYLMLGAWKLDRETKKIVAQNVKKIINEKAKFKGETFKYDCPFLIDNVCCVYEYRGIVCRTFGLLYIGKDSRVKIPFCCFEGFNYSNVIDENRKISSEKVKKLGLEEIPSAYNVSYEFLTDADFEKMFKFEFGDKKPLIEWFMDQEVLKIDEQDKGNI